MKTVQQYLRELDTRKLVDAFLEKEPVNYEKPGYKHDLTVRMIRNHARKTIREYINRLRSLEVRPSLSGKRYVLFVHDVIDEQDDICTELIDPDELLEKGPKGISSWAYEFNEQAEIVGYHVADTEMNRKHIYELIADVMYEAAFFGFGQESLEKEKRVLDKALEEAEAIRNGENSYTRLEDTEFYRNYIATRDPEEEKLRRKLTDAQAACNRYFRIRELNAVAESPRASQTNIAR